MIHSEILTYLTHDISNMLNQDLLQHLLKPKCVKPNIDKNVVCRSNTLGLEKKRVKCNKNLVSL